MRACFARSELGLGARAHGRRKAGALRAHQDGVHGGECRARAREGLLGRPRNTKSGGRIERKWAVKQASKKVNWEENGREIATVFRKNELYFSEGPPFYA